MKTPAHSRRGPVMETLQAALRHNTHPLVTLTDHVPNNAAFIEIDENQQQRILLNTAWAPVVRRLGITPTLEPPTRAHMYGLMRGILITAALVAGLVVVGLIIVGLTHGR